MKLSHESLGFWCLHRSRSKHISWAHKPNTPRKICKKKRYEAFSSPFLLSQRSLQQSQELSRLRSTITTPALTRSFSSNFTSSSVRQQGDLVSLRWFQDKGWTFAFSWWEFDRTLGWLIINEATMVVLVGNPLYAHLVSYGRSSSCFLRWKIDTNVYSQQWPQQSCSI